MKEYKILSMDKAVIRKNSIRTEHLCNPLLSKPGAAPRLEAIQNVTILHRAEKVAARVFAEHSPVQPPEIGPVVAVRQAGGLHHRYERRAA
jgi:hypothetical protein